MTTRSQPAELTARACIPGRSARSHSVGSRHSDRKRAAGSVRNQHVETSSADDVVGVTRWQQQSIAATRIAALEGDAVAGAVSSATAYVPLGVLKVLCNFRFVALRNRPRVSDSKHAIDATFETPCFELHVGRSHLGNSCACSSTS